MVLKSLHPYHKKLTEKRFKLHPYYGFTPIEEEPKEVKEFKFLPYHGFVPADETVPDEEALLKNLHPYHKKMASKKFKLDPYYGFVPIMEEEVAVSERKMRDATIEEKSQDLSLPPPPHPYNFHPFLVLGGAKPDDTENKLYKYVPYYGFVPAEEKANDEDPEAEADDEEKEETAEEMSEQQYKFVPFYGFVPVNEDGEVEETAKNYGNLKYTFHPYYGFLPTPTDGEVEEQLYKLDPVVGFYPSEKEETQETELDAKRKKREAQFLLNPVYPVYPVQQQVVLVPTGTEGEDTQTGKTGNTDTEGGEKTQITQQILTTYPVVPVPVFGSQFLFRYPQFTYPVATLPEEYPVIPHDPEDKNEGSVEF